MPKTLEITNANLHRLFDLVKTDPRVAILCECDENGAVTNRIHTVLITGAHADEVGLPGDLLGINYYGVVTHVYRKRVI